MPALKTCEGCDGKGGSCAGCNGTGVFIPSRDPATLMEAMRDADAIYRAIRGYEAARIKVGLFDSVRRRIRRIMGGPKAMDEIRLGDKVRDTVTGFVGTVTARVEYLNGCRQLCVQPAMGSDGKFPEGVYLDHQRVELVAGAEPIRASDTGGHQRDQPPAAYRG